MTKRMSRRGLFGLLPFTAMATDKFGASNLPQCPVCHTPVPADTPEYYPVVQNMDTSMAGLAGVRELFCGNCGNAWIVRA